MLRTLTPLLLLLLAACAGPARVAQHQLPLHAGQVTEASFGSEAGLDLHVQGPSSTRVRDLEVVEIDGRTHLVGRLDTARPFHHAARLLKLQAVDAGDAIVAESAGHAAEGSLMAIRRDRRSMPFSLPIPETSGAVALRLIVGA